jgi:drug/metabolite transporter (DMT)-like permease
MILITERIATQVKKSVFLPYLQLTGAMIIVGSNIIVGKLISTGFPLFLAATLRFALASALLLLLVLRVEKQFPRIMKRDLLAIFLLSFFGNFLYSIFLLYGLKLTSASESGIISGTAPVVTAVLSNIFLRERLGQKKIFGLLLVILGMGIINLSGNAPSGARYSVVGDLLICGSVIGEALWTTLGKTVSPKVSPLVLATLTTFCGFLLFLPFGIVQAIGFPFQSLSASGWLSVLYYGSVGTVGAYLLWYQGIPKVPATTAGVFVGVMPVSTVILSYVLLKEPFLWTQVLGILCVLAALACITIDIRLHKRRSPSPRTRSPSV